MHSTHNTVFGLFGLRRFSKFLQQLQQVWPKYSDEVGPNNAIGKGCRVSYRWYFPRQIIVCNELAESRKYSLLAFHNVSLFFLLFLPLVTHEILPRIGMTPATTVMRLSSTTSWFSSQKQWKNGASWLAAQKVTNLCQHTSGWKSHVAWEVGEITNLAYMRYIMLNHQTKKMSMSKINE